MAVESVTLHFTDASAVAVPNVAFNVSTVGMAATDPTGIIALSLADGTYTINPVSGHGVIFAPRTIVVDNTHTTFTIAGLAAPSAASVDRNADYLVKMVRNLINEKGSNEPYRDGFSADAAYDDSAISILGAINIAQREYAKTGYAKCYFDTTLSAATSDARNNEYVLDSKIHRVVSIVVFDLTGRPYPLRESPYDSLDIMRAQWRSANPGPPREYYTYSNIIGFSPAPNAAYSAQVLANTVMPDLVDETDVPQKLAAYFHEGLAYGGALQISVNQVENEAAQRRVPYLQGKWNDFVEELTRISQSRPIASVQAILPGNVAKRL